MPRGRKRQRPICTIPGKEICAVCLQCLDIEKFHRSALVRRHNVCRWCRRITRLGNNTPGKSCKRDPVKLSARRKFRQAVVAGKIIKPNTCERCLSPVARHLLDGHHHKGYENPFDVQWLCRPCHSLVEHY